MKAITHNTAALFFVLIIGSYANAQENLSISDALNLALSANPELQAGALEVSKTAQGKLISRSLFLPKIHAGGWAHHYFKRPAFFGFGSSNTETEKIPYGRFGGNDQLGFGITAVQPLYTPLGLASLEQSRLAEQHEATRLKAKQVQVLSQVKEKYLSILVLEERIRLKRESIARNKRVLQDSRILFLQGKALRVDTLRAFTAVKNLEPDLVKLTYAAETKRLHLKAMIGMESNGELILTDSLAIPVPETIPAETDVYEDVIRNNPEFQALNVQRQLAKQQMRISSAYRLPTLSLVAQYQVQTQTNDLAFGRAHYPASSYIGLQIDIPLFAGFSHTARMKQSALSKKQADVSVVNEQKRLRALVHEAIANYRESLLRLQNTAIVKETAALSYDIIQYRYKNGISPRLDLTDAELALSEAQSNYLEALYDYLSARIALRSLRGIAETD